MAKDWSSSVITFSHNQVKRHYDNNISIENSPAKIAPPSHQITASYSSNASVVVTDSIQEYSKHLASKHDGTEYIDGRQIVTADFDEDGAPEAVALIIIEGAGGGGLIIPYIVLFEQQNARYIPTDLVIIEGAHDLSLSENNLIEVDAAIHSPNDPKCCPTINISHLYSTKNRKLIELKNRIHIDKNHKH